MSLKQTARAKISETYTES